MVISMLFSEFASTFFEQPVRRNRFILWRGMVFSMILINDLHVNRIILIFLGARSASELSQRHLRLHDVFRIMLAESFVNRGSGKNFVYQERHFECIERYMSFETFSKQIFRNMFLNKQQFIFEQTTTHF